MERLFNLNSRIAVVTGVAGKLGLVWSETLLEAGAIVIGIDVPNVNLPQKYYDLREEYGEDKFYLLYANILEREALEKIKRYCIENIGSPTILINNAGIDQPPGIINSFRLEEIPLDICRNILDVNVLGAFQTMQVFGETMVHNKKGSIINIGSLYASVSPDAKLYEHIPCDPPFIKPPAYGASKAALVQLTKYFATHWGAYNVRVNTLSPGGVLGGQDEDFKKKFCSRVPLGRMADYTDLIGPLLFLASDASAYVTGIELRIDGGFTAW